MTTGSIVVRRSLGRRLRALRGQAGKTAADVTAAGIASKAKLARIEAGTGAVKMADVRALCWLYGADQNTTDALAELALNTAGEGWWEDFGDVVPQWFGLYVELEAAATSLLTWDAELVHGLLQTPAYHEAVFEADPEFSSESADRQVRLRLQRQRTAFEKSPPLQIQAVLGEGAITRLVGGHAARAGQREHLVSLSARTNVDIRVLTWEAGAHATMKSGFTILGFNRDESPDVLYFETQAGGRYIENEGMVQAYRRRFETLRDLSVPIEEYNR